MVLLNTGAKRLVSKIGAWPLAILNNIANNKKDGRMHSMEDIEREFADDKGISDAERDHQVKEGLRYIAELASEQMQALERGGFPPEVAAPLAGQVYQHLMEKVFHDKEPVNPATMFARLLGGGH